MKYPPFLVAAREERRENVNTDLGSEVLGPDFTSGSKEKEALVPIKPSKAASALLFSLEELGAGRTPGESLHIFRSPLES